MAPVRIPYPKFEKMLDAYGKDQVAARELLDPVMVENIVELNNSFGGRKFSASFQDSKLFIMIHTRKSFFTPPPIWRPITSMKDFKDIEKEFENLTSLAETLELTRKRLKNHA